VVETSVYVTKRRRSISGILSVMAGSALAFFELLRPHVPAVGPELITDAAMMGIYRVGDSRVGQWSKPVSVTVGG